MHTAKIEGLAMVIPVAASPVSLAMVTNSNLRWNNSAVAEWRLLVVELAVHSTRKLEVVNSQIV